ncbi:MAG TPA: cupin domain-containing protein [Aridibacter sp.]|nr:cupin domain-containing protein [Aridibacter sp.]
MSDDERRFPADPKIRFTIDCDDLEFALSEFIDKQEYRLFSIFPADEPRRAIVERDGTYVMLEKKADPGSEEPKTSAELRGIVVTLPDDSEWHEGRAGMLYRDLLPCRAGGRLIASQIRIPDGGPVPDYVHFHKVAFQVIFCLKGSCRLVYEYQGEPFDFSAGDCVLQPPGIRHRVLECSDGFEVLELSSPAEHPTYADHEMDLPNPHIDPEKDFAGQHFHRHIAKDGDGPRTDLGLAEPSSGAVLGELIRPRGSRSERVEFGRPDSALVYVAEGGAEMTGGPSGPLVLAEGSSCFIPEVPDSAIECTDASALIFRLRL